MKEKEIGLCQLLFLEASYPPGWMYRFLTFLLLILFHILAIVSELQ